MSTATSKWNLAPVEDAAALPVPDARGRIGGSNLGHGVHNRSDDSLFVACTAMDIA